VGSGRGGGIYLAGDATLMNNIIVQNQVNVLGSTDVNQPNLKGSGIYIPGASPYLYHNTIVNNIGNGGWDGTGIYVQEALGERVAQPKLFNTIIANQTEGVYVDGNVLNVAVLDGVLWWNNGANTTGSGTVIATNETTGDPAFVNPTGTFVSPFEHGYHIDSGSAAIDAGVDYDIDADVDGQPRPHYGGYDLGADEWWPLVVVETGTPNAAEPGDVVTYTITLTNATNTAMSVHLTDTLSSYVDYLGPLDYNNGDGGYASGVVTWAGTVLTATPTFIAFPVQVVSSAPPSATLTST